jgi:heat shock protein HslJ
MKRILTLLMIATCLTSCSVFKNKQQNMEQQESQTVFGVEWKLKQIGNKVMKYDEEREIITLLMTSEPENVSGFSACNRYFGKFTLKKGVLTFKDMASTAMMCPEQTMELERRYLMQLDKVNNFVITEEGELHLRKDEKVLLIFAQ